MTTTYTAEGRLRHHMAEIKAMRDALATGQLSVETYQYLTADLTTAQRQIRTLAKAARIEQGSI